METTYRILKIVILILLLVVLILGATRLYDFLSAQVQPQTMAQEAQSEESQAPRKKAPDFTVVDSQGEACKLSDFAGQPVVLNFWASWCGPCQMEMPYFEEKYLEYGDRVAFLMVNLTDGSQETLETAKEFIQQTDYTFPVYYDTRLDAAYRYGLTSVPMTYFVDEQGCIATYQKGIISAEGLQSGIDLLLG